MDKLLRFSDLKAAGIVRSRMQLKRLQEGAGFPPGFRLSANTRVWRQSEIQLWIERREQDGGGATTEAL